MISFKNWTISADSLEARQFDHLSRRLDVIGALPPDWQWHMLVQAGDALDIIPLSPIEGGVGHILTEDHLSIAGYYSMQLRGIKDDTIRHTNVIYVYIPASLSGSVRAQQKTPFGAQLKSPI